MISFRSLRRRRHARRLQLPDVFSQVSLLPSLLHLADLLGEEGLQSRDQLGDHLQVAEANLQREETSKKKKMFVTGAPPLFFWMAWSGWPDGGLAGGVETDPHVVEGDADALGEVGAEQRDLSVALTEVVQHDEVGVHLHPDADGLRGRAGRSQAIS